MRGQFERQHGWAGRGSRAGGLRTRFLVSLRAFLSCKN